MRAIRFHYGPVRYLLTRAASGRWPGVAWSRLGCVRLDEVTPPTLPGPEWVRVATSLSGVCGSDLAAVTAHDSFTLEPFAAFPFTFGHENVGVIAELGAAAGDWAVGDRVVVSPMLACLQRGLTPRCAACAGGEYGLCTRTGEGTSGRGPMIGYAPRTGGGWSAEFVAHRSQLHRVGDAMADELAVLTDPLASALRPVLLHPPQDGDTVLVIGAGSIGLLTVAALRATGWTGPIAVVGRHAAQAERAERAGASVVLRSRDATYAWAAALPGAQALKPSLAPRFVEGGPSLVYDTVGSAGTLQDALSLTRGNGRVVLVGGAAQTKLDLTRLWYRHLTLAGIFAYGPVPWRGGTCDIYAAALDLLATDPRFAELGLVTHTFPIEDYHTALAVALDKGGTGSIKVVFRPRA